MQIKVLNEDGSTEKEYKYVCQIDSYRDWLTIGYLDLNANRHMTAVDINKYDVVITKKPALLRGG